MNRTFTFLFAAVIISLTAMSCRKAVCTEPGKQSEPQSTIAGYDWMIDEVVDPISGVRFKRGVQTDEKNFAIARFRFTPNGAYTGISWDGSQIANARYAILNDGRTLQLILPACTSMNEIRELRADKFVYISNDGSVFTLVPYREAASKS